mgnify:CR=1 FL=1
MPKNLRIRQAKIKKMEWFLKVLRQYADFNGRSRRKEYWMFILFNMIVGFVAMLLDNLLGIADPVIGYGAIYGLYTLALIIPGIAVAVSNIAMSMIGTTSGIDNSGNIILHPSGSIDIFTSNGIYNNGTINMIGGIITIEENIPNTIYGGFIINDVKGFENTIQYDYLLYLLYFI